MPNEGYRSRLEKWEAEEKRRREVQETEKPYNPKEMRQRMPLGCLIAAFLLAGFMFYYLGKLAGLWKGF